ncbi:MAG TPA: DUF1385 domain-containing protein [Candidatus Limousia pullorum]|uniref:DUF1385 domain-containing protein n=1 Tax=Candidatus Limousia pullorum TaxID=2840860 RepID=A0A9D1S7I0_9FIRM|nr:DUF1385 domain-containing protein [Candidatus Limousia pullorum]
MKKHKENVKKITSIGGSALIEGIMMRGPKKTTVAVRTGKDEIYKEDVAYTTISSKGKFFRLPFIRGIVGLIDSMKLSYKSLAISADKAMGDAMEEEPESRFEKWLVDKFGEKMMTVLMWFAGIVGVLLAVLLFFFLPSFLFDLSSNAVPAFQGDGKDVVFYKSVFEGILKIVIFLGYILLVSGMEDMKRVFMYHGAEHKTIFCYESDEELTVENVRKHTRFHPRCGTSFMVLMLVVGIIVGLFVPVAPFGIPVLRPVIKILLLPISCGIGYELIKLCGKYDNLATRIIAAPGMWAQRITTKEPDDSMIEVAIAAIKEVIPEDGSDILTAGK